MQHDLPVRLTPETYDGEDVRDRLRQMATEMRAEELLYALACAVAGAPGWRAEARMLLREIHEGIVQEPQE